MQCADAMLSSMACPAVQYFSTLPHKQHDFRRNIYWKQNVCFGFLYNFVWNISRSKKNWGDITIYIGLLLTYPFFLSDFHKPWIFSTHSFKILVAEQPEFEPKDCQTKSRTISNIQCDNYFCKKEAVTGSFLGIDSSVSCRLTEQN